MNINKNNGMRALQKRCAIPCLHIIYQISHNDLFCAVCSRSCTNIMSCEITALDKQGSDESV